MSRYKAILFDMDGTLLPMDMDEFTNGYFKFLCAKLAPYNIPAKQLIADPKHPWEGPKGTFAEMVEMLKSLV